MGINIVLTIGDISIGGGAERVVVNLAHALLEAGHSVEILSFYKSKDDLPYPIDAKINLRFLHNASQDKMRKKPFYKLYYKALESYKINKMYANADVIIFNNSPHYPFFKHKNIKYIKLMHTRFTKFLKRFSNFDALVILSKKELDIWQSYHKNVCVIPNFIPTFPQIKSDCAKKVVLSIGRITPNDEKGFFRLIDIWENLASDFSEWKLNIICGVESKDEIYKEQLQKAILAKGLQKSVILKPFTKDIQTEYLNASIYALTSLWEGFSMVLAEASSYGIACVAFDIKTGPSDIIEHKKSGFLIKDGDLESYANALRELMGNSQIREEMGANASEFVKKFSKEAIMQKWQELFKTLCAV